MSNVVIMQNYRTKQKLKRAMITKLNLMQKNVQIELELGDLRQHVRCLEHEFAVNSTRIIDINFLLGTD